MIIVVVEDNRILRKRELLIYLYRKLSPALIKTNIYIRYICWWLADNGKIYYYNVYVEVHWKQVSQATVKLSRIVYYYSPFLWIGGIILADGVFGSYDELEEYEMDPDAYCAKHDSEIAKWVIQSCLECYRDTLYEEGYTEEYGIALEDFCLLHQIGEVGSFNHQEVPDFDCLQDFISYFRNPCHFTVFWDAVISISCDDAYVGDLWGDDDWGFDKEAYDSYPQYIPCKVNCQVNEEKTIVVTIDFNKRFISNLDTGNSYSQIIEFYHFQRKVEEALLGKTIEEAETFCKTNHIKIGWSLTLTT